MLTDQYKESLKSYNFINTEIDGDNLCVKNTYITSIVQNLGTCFTNNLIPSYDFDEIPINTDKGQLVNILNLPALNPLQGVATIYDEMSLAMFNTVSPLINKDLSFWQQYKRMLVIDYLLSSSICLVEQYNTLGNKIDKFYATRNPHLIVDFTGNEEKLTKYINHIKYNEYGYTEGMLTLIKLRATSNGDVKETIPRSPINFNMITKITPFHITRGMLGNLDNLLQNGIYKIHYIKDNITMREIITTKDRAYLAKWYNSDMTARMILNQTSNLLRGYVHVPEVGISKYDSNGTRALNISRIIKIEKMNVNDIDTQYINVDFNNIVPAFNHGVRQTYDMDVLNKIYHDFTGSTLPPQVGVAQNAQELLISFISTQVAVGTTTALKRLHSYMVTQPNTFKGYTGERRESVNVNIGMMGVVEG